MKAYGNPPTLTSKYDCRYWHSTRRGQWHKAWRRKWKRRARQQAKKECQE